MLLWQHRYNRKNCWKTQIKFIFLVHVCQDPPGGDVLSMSRYVYRLRGKDPPFSTPMVRQMTLLFQHGPTYDLFFSLVWQMTLIFPYFRIWCRIMHVFWHLIHVRCSRRNLPGDVSLERQSITKYVEFGPLYFPECRVMTHIFSQNVEFWPLYFPRM